MTLDTNPSQRGKDDGDTNPNQHGKDDGDPKKRRYSMRRWVRLIRDIEHLIVILTGFALTAITCYYLVVAKVEHAAVAVPANVSHNANSEPSVSPGKRDELYTLRDANS